MNDKPIVESRSRWDGSGFIVSTRIMKSDGSVEILEFKVGPDVDPMEAGAAAAQAHMEATAGQAQQGDKDGNASTGSGGDGDTGNDAEGETGDADGGDNGDGDSDGNDDDGDSDDGDDSEGEDSDNEKESESDKENQDNQKDGEPAAKDPPAIFWQMLTLKWGMIHQPEIVNRDYK